MAGRGLCLLGGSLLNLQFTLLKADTRVIDKFNALLHEQVDASVDDFLVQFEVGNAIAQQSARSLVLVEDRHLITHLVQAVGRHQSGGTSPDDSHSFAIPLVLLRSDVLLPPGCLRYGRFIFTVSGRRMVCEVEHASLLTECRADTSRKLGEVIGGVEQPVGQFPLSLPESVVPLRGLVVQRTSPVAERYATVHASACLHLSVMRVERLLHLTEILDSIVYRTVPGLQSWHLHECFQFSHFKKAISC